MSVRGLSKSIGYSSRFKWSIVNFIISCPRIKTLEYSKYIWYLIDIDYILRQKWGRIVFIFYFIFFEKEMHKKEHNK